ncbi:hypothetical protein FRB94_006772 [Tulasnella sp. JGI-2019a]|nr:hypothetical protein FRB94_006772 [Tulasnella sp. JGI-2019a]KAG9016229.1 hypothetical protein FRB93_011703 [Tulasnella sp. JGI-2019a]KAG9036457.1 hypothetical protein FRB95_008755 [Tulasnella sp. JGI-2019a]
MQSMNTKPIIIVTGANQGVGFGICERLLFQLSCSSLPDAELHPEGAPIVPTKPATPVSGLTLILACRNPKRAQEARKKLLKLLDNHLEDRRSRQDDDGHGDVFRKGLRIDFVKCDLSTSSGAFDFCDQVERSYSYISHLVCNAGIMDFSHINYWLAIKHFLSGPIDFATYPIFKVQYVGSTSPEGLGLTFQCNLFGHYILTRRLEPLLRRAPSQGRVLWTSSLDAFPRCFDIDDWQSLKSNRSYEGTKYATDLVVMQLNKRAISQATPNSSAGEGPRHILIHPGITLTEIVTSQLGMQWLTGFLAWFAMILARWLGSINHPLKLVGGAISATFAILAPLSSLPSPTEPVKLGSRATWFGSPYVGVDQVADWDVRQADAAEVLRKCEVLYTNVLKERKATQNENVNGH